MDGLIFADNLAKYITTRNQSVAARALQGVTNKLDAWVAERVLILFTSKTVNIVFIKKEEKKTKNQ